MSDTVARHAAVSPTVRFVVAAHLSITAFLVIVNLSPLIDSWIVSTLVELNAESNAAVWFSSTSLLALAIIAFDLAARHRADRLPWALIGAMFALLSLDETAAIHELVGTVFSARVGEFATLPGLYAWVVLLTPVALVAALLMGRWLCTKAVAGTPERWFIFGALTLWFLVPVAEFLDPILGMPRGLVVMEESLELVGMALMLGALLQLHVRLNRALRGNAVLDGVLDRLAEPV
jgi:hypothetical protein